MEEEKRKRKKKCVYFSSKIQDAVAKADDTLVAVRIAKLCISEKIPFNVISAKLKVSRATIYAWFTGKAKPIQALEGRLLELEAMLMAAKPEVEETPN